MLKRLVAGSTLALAVLVCLCSAARAAETLTSEDVMKKSAEAYKAMKTYYEESEFTKVVDYEGKQQIERDNITVAFKRPSTFLLTLTDGRNITSSYSGTTLTKYNSSEQLYTKQENVTLEQIVTNLEYPIPATALSEDPYQYMMEDVNKVGALKTSDLNGKQVYEIDFDLGDGMSAAHYFDMSRFYLVGIKADLQGPAERGGGRVTLTMNARKVLIDELPKDAAGKETDVFAFTVPSEAKELKPEQMDKETEALKGSSAPDWTLKDQAGNDVRLSSLKGNVVLLAFWATWCSPCREELPTLAKMVELYKDKPLAYYAVDDTEDAKVISEYTKGIDFKLPVLVGAGTTIGGDYKIVALPSLFVIDKKGVIRETFVGVTSVETIKPAIDKLLEEPAQ